MPLMEIGTIVLVLLVIVILGNLWFHFVEAILERIRRLFHRKKESPAWHPLPPEQEDREDR